MRSTLLVALAALAASALLPAAANGAGRIPVDVRVVTFEGKILADRSIGTGTTTIRTSSRATCLGGEPPNGKRRIAGATALGALADLRRQVGTLGPLLLSGAFDFGIGVCGVGSSIASGEQWWALKVNGRFSSTGGDSTTLKKGDRVLWYLDRSYAKPFPGELRLSVTGGSARSSLEVRVVSLDGVGERSPVAGAKVFAGGLDVARTDRSGRATLRVPTRGRKRVSVVARLGGNIPSNRVRVGNDS